MQIPIYQIDAFTSRLFGGNPAAVCPLSSWPEDALLQSIAAENNLSETAFLVAREEHYELRWFTPATEIDLCGHATLAAAFVVFHYLNIHLERVVFTSRSGELTVSRDGSHLVLDFPVMLPAPCQPPTDLAKALGVPPKHVLRSRDYLAVYEDEQQILDLRPDLERLAGLDCTGVIVTAPGRRADFVSRFFAPRVGVAEDPVTGSAHCTLTPYWAQRLGKKELQARQLSARGGELACSLEDDRVLIAGEAVLYLEGSITV